MTASASRLMTARRRRSGCFHGSPRDSEVAARACPHPPLYTSPIPLPYLPLPSFDRRPPALPALTLRPSLHLNLTPRTPPPPTHLE